MTFIQVMLATILVIILGGLVMSIITVIVLIQGVMWRALVFFRHLMAGGAANILIAGVISAIVKGSLK